MDSPEAVLLAALALRDRLDYAGVVALCDPASLEFDFRQQCEHLRPRTEEEFLRDNPDFPVAKAAAGVAYFNRRSLEQVPQFAPGITTYEDFVALEPAEYYRHWLEKEDFRLEVIRRMRARGMTVPDAAFEPPTGVAFEILGAESVSEDEVIVSYRQRFNGDEGIDPEDIEQETLRCTDGGRWRLVARYDLLQSRGSVANILEGELAALFLDDEASA
jgi:hypothetical protein